MRLPRVRFTVRRVILTIMAGVSLAGWVYQCEAWRVEEYQRIQAEQARLAERSVGGQAAFHTWQSEIARRRAVWWSQGPFGPQPAAVLGVIFLGPAWWAFYVVVSACFAPRRATAGRLLDRAE